MRPLLRFYGKAWPISHPKNTWSTGMLCFGHFFLGQKKWSFFCSREKETNRPNFRLKIHFDQVLQNGLGILLSLLRCTEFFFLRCLVADNSNHPDLVTPLGKTQWIPEVKSLKLGICKSDIREVSRNMPSSWSTFRKIHGKRFEKNSDTKLKIRGLTHFFWVVARWHFRGIFRFVIKLPQYCKNQTWCKSI